MIFDLSKDKSLLNLLSKVDLDEETSNLVKSKASVSSIRKSLESNITSSNLIQYRKYILKAKEDEDEKEEREAAEQREEAAHSETRQMTGSAGSYEDVHADMDSRAKKEEAATLNAAQVKKRKYKKAVKDFSIIKKAIIKLKDIQSEVNENNKIMSKTYDTIPKKQSNFIITWLTFLNKDKKSLVRHYQDLLTKVNLAGKNEEDRFIDVLLGKSWDEDDNESDVKEADILIEDIQTELNNLLDTTFTLGASRNMGFLEVMIKLHHSTYNSEPVTSVNLKQRRDNLNAFLASINSEGNSEEEEEEDTYSEVAERMEELNSSLESLQGKKLSLENELEKLNNVGSSIDNMIANKLQQLTRGLNAVLNDSKRLNLTDEFIKDKLQSMKELKDNPKKYEQELRTEIEDKVEITQAKLDKIIDDLDRFDRFDTSLQRFIALIKLHEGERPMEEVRELMIKVSTRLVAMKRRVKELNTIIEESNQIMASWMMEQTNLSPVHRRIVDRVDTLTNEYAKLNTDVAKMIDKIDALL